MVCVPEATFAYVNWTLWTVQRLNQILLHELTHWATGKMVGHKEWNGFLQTVSEKCPKSAGNWLLRRHA